MEASVAIQSVTTPAQSDQAVREAGRLLSEAFAYGDDCYERPEYAAAKAILMESAKFESMLTGRTVSVEFDIAYGLAFDVAYE